MRRWATPVRSLLGLCLASCAPEDQVWPATQITVSVECRDEELLDRIDMLRVTVARASTGGAGERVWQGVSTKSAAIPARNIARWPAEVPVLPSSEKENGAAFEVVVDALDTRDRLLAQVRGITRFDPGEQLRFRLSLEPCDGAERGVGFVCTQDPGCHGTACTFCGASGSCEEVQFTDPKTLPDLEDVIADGGDVPSDAGVTVPAMPSDERRDAGAEDAPPSCEEGALRCSESSERARERCTAGRWTVSSPCAVGSVCAPESDVKARCESSGSTDTCSDSSCRDGAVGTDTDTGTATPRTDAGVDPPEPLTDGGRDASSPGRPDATVPDAAVDGGRGPAGNADAAVLIDASRRPADASDLADFARPGGA